MHLLFGEQAKYWKVSVFGEHYPSFLVIVLPPGAFIVTGFLIALKTALIHVWKHAVY